MQSALNAFDASWAQQSCPMPSSTYFIQIELNAFYALAQQLSPKYSSPVLNQNRQAPNSIHIEPNSLDLTWVQQFGPQLMGKRGGVPRAASSKRETDRGTSGLRTRIDMTARLDAMRICICMRMWIWIAVFDVCSFTLPSPSTSGADPYCWGELLG